MEHIIKGDKGDGIPNILSPDDCFVAQSRQKPVSSKKLAEWVQSTPDEFANRTDLDADVIRSFNRNRYLIDFDYIPDTVRNNILDTWVNRVPKDRSQLLNYFMENRMKNMIELIGEF
jgi:hypothetical protein